MNGSIIPADNRKPEQVIKCEFLQEYDAAHNDIWHRLVQVNTSIQIIEIVASYPIVYLFAPSEAVFFDLLYWNFNYTCIVMLHALLSDSNGFTIQHFSDKLKKLWLIDNEIESFVSRLDKFCFTDKSDEIRSRLSKIRNKIIAHRDRKIVNETLKIPGLAITDLRTLYNETEALFCVCSFHSEYVTTLYTRGTVGGKPIQKDIEYMMDLLIKNSHWLNKPERRDQFWQSQKKYEPPEQIAELNKWRNKFGMTESRGQAGGI
jgi:hypothetical protein